MKWFLFLLFRVLQMDEMDRNADLLFFIFILIVMQVVSKNAEWQEYYKRDGFQS